MTTASRPPPKVGETVEDPVHGYSVRFLQIGSDTSVAELESTAESQASGPPAHTHPKSYERFEVLSGAVMLKTGRDSRVVESGEKVTVPPGASTHGTTTPTNQRSCGLKWTPDSPSPTSSTNGTNWHEKADSTARVTWDFSTPPSSSTPTSKMG